MDVQGTEMIEKQLWRSFRNFRKLRRFLSDGTPVRSCGWFYVTAQDTQMFQDTF